MEIENLLDIDNPLHVDCLRFCFGRLIKEEIEVTRKEWNEHRIRKQNNRNCLGGNPNELYYLPANFGSRDCRKVLDTSCIDVG